MKNLTLITLLILSACEDISYQCDISDPSSHIYFRITNNDTLIFVGTDLRIQTLLNDSTNYLNDNSVDWSINPNIGWLEFTNGSNNIYHAPDDLAYDTISVQVTASLRAEPSYSDILTIKIYKESTPPDTGLCFERDILPIFRNNCAISGCHDPQTSADDLDFSNYNGIMEKIDPFDTRGSKIYRVITEDEASDIMPPPPYSALSQEEIDLIARWINEGAENSSCYELECDSLNVTYSNQVSVIINKYCIGCHSTVPSGNVYLNSYSNVRKEAEQGRLLGSIEHANGYVPMPYNQAKLSDCEIAIIRNWILSGMKE